MMYPFLFIFAAFFTVPPLSFGAERVPVEGEYCYRYGDDESVTVAKTKSLAFAREVAVSNYKVWVEVNTEVKDFELEKDWIETIAVGMLRGEKRQVNRKIQEICTSLKAWINPQEVDDFIAQRRKQREVKQRVSSEDAESAFDLKIWLDKPNGRYVEGENVIIKVKSERDAYLKLDYFQADCKVVHLIPNLWHQSAFIKKGQTYAFGTEESAERFRIQGPFGVEVIKAQASTNPFPASQVPRQTISNCEPYVRKIEESRTRGISLENNLSSAEVSLFTASKEVSEHQKVLGE